MGSFRDLLFTKKLFFSYGNFRNFKTISRRRRYSLTDQIRRSSRSVCSNLAESYKKDYTLLIF